VNINDLTLDVVKSYADACRQLRVCIEVLQAEGHDLLVVPSRGAHPFLHGATCYAHQVAPLYDNSFFGPPIKQIEELYLPFTADISKDQPISSAAIRLYWSRVLRAILKRDKSDVGYRFYEFLRKRTGRLALGSTDIDGGRSGKFIFVDTVVSGQAIHEIIEGFNSCGLTDCHFLLLIDEDGKKLKPAYESTIDQMVSAGRAAKIVVTKIFTEDEGPAMSGIWTVTMPELTVVAQNTPGLAGVGDIAATLFYCEVARRKDDSNYDISLSNAKLNTLLYSAVGARDEVTESFLEEFRKHVGGAKLQDQAVTKRVAEPLIKEYLPINSTNVSGSHVIRAMVGEKEAEKMVREFLKSEA
jgi:hypothetical protein